MNSSKVKITQTVPLFDVADMERSVAFYVDGLGFDMQNRWEKDGELQWRWLRHFQKAIAIIIAGMA